MSKMSEQSIYMIRALFGNELNMTNPKLRERMAVAFDLNGDQIYALRELCDWIGDHELEYAHKEYWNKESE